MNILVFGATGKTGKEFVAQALQNGHFITSIVRSASAIDFTHPNLVVVKGEVLDLDVQAQYWNNIDAIVSCLGVRHRRPTTIYSDGIRNILTAMKLYDIKRVVCLSAGAVIIPPKASFVLKFLTKYVLQPLLKYAYADMLKMEEILALTKLNWTIVRPPRLTNGKRKGEYRISVNNPINRPSSIARSDLADYLLNHLTDETTHKGIVEISY